MKRLISFLLCLLVFLLAGCSKSEEVSVLEQIRNSPMARMELPDGTTTYVDSEITSLQSFSDLSIMMAPLEPADNENDWLYRIVFNPSEKVQNTAEIVVSFHEQYLQIGNEYYSAETGVSFDEILQWAKLKFDTFMVD